MATRLFSVTGKVLVEVTTLVRAESAAEALEIAKARPVEKPSRGWEEPPGAFKEWLLYTGRVKTADILEIEAAALLS